MLDPFPCDSRPVRLYETFTHGGQETHWLPLWEAALLFNGGYGDSDITLKVRETDGLVRSLSQGEMEQMLRIADLYRKSVKSVMAVAYLRGQGC